jgi:hypothetical protein
MDALTTTFRIEDAMHRAFEPSPTRDTFRPPISAAAAPPRLPAARRLPPTRAARFARSRGVFFAGLRRSRFGPWIANAACVAMVALAILASAHFAEPAFDASAISGNSGPELLASATRAPSFLIGSGR